MAHTNPQTVGELFDIVRNNDLSEYSEGAQMALASAVSSLLNDSSSGIREGTWLATDNALTTIYHKLCEEGRTSDMRLIWALKSKTGNPTEEALCYIDSFAE